LKYLSDEFGAAWIRQTPSADGSDMTYDIRHVIGRQLRGEWQYRLSEGPVALEALIVKARESR
jgi:hypothetical protein